MKLPIAWLKEYIDTKLSLEKLEEILTLSGTKVEGVEGSGDQAVLDIEVTTNRPDCLSVLGLAQEISALTQKKVRSPYPAKTKVSKKIIAPKRIPISVLDKRGCPLYTARWIESVSVKDSPEKIKQLLTLMGTRPISNVVDATNFVLFECGQPLHAFDFDKLQGGQIIVRRSRTGEKLLGIDGVEYVLDDQTLVIADCERPVAIAGVIGGRQTEVTPETKNILLESAYFDPALVRRASKQYKISTDSSYRFERGVNPQWVARASQRALDLIGAWASGRDSSGLIQKSSIQKKKTRRVLCRLEHLERILGIRVPQKRAVQILKNLCLEAKPHGARAVSVTPSALRRDIQNEADVAEEILRIEGFDKIPVSIPVTRHPEVDVQSRKAARIFEIKKFLAALGFQEIITYSLLSEVWLKNSGIDPATCHRVANAVSVEQGYFRPSLLPGMMESLLFNIYRKAASLKFFEIGNCYVRGVEETKLSLALTGNLEENWRRKSEVSFYDLKGILQRLEDFCGVQGEGQKISLDLLRRWDIPKEVYYAELSLENVFETPPRAWQVKPISKFPVVRRDIAFVIDARVPVADLEALIRNALTPHLLDVTLFDEYIGKNIPSGKRSLAFALAYQKDSGTFTEDEIGVLQKKVCEVLKSAHAIEFR